MTQRLSQPYLSSAAVGVFLIAQGLVTTLVSNSSPTRLALPLEDFPVSLGDGRWKSVRESRLAPGEAAVLRADRVLLRSYESTAGPAAPLHLLIAYFESQAYGRTPHSPKNCLPGSGFEPVESSAIHVGDFPVNRYVLAREENRILTLYWYQSGRRAIASEYAAKLFLVQDALVHRRTETMIVRVSATLQHAADTETEREALAFVGAVHRAVLPHLAQ
jgi:EpsI family protein